MLKSFKKWLRSEETRTIVKNPTSSKKIRVRPKLERLEDRITPSITYQGGPVIPHPQLQALYLGADWGGAFGFGDQVVDLFDKLPPPASTVPTTFSEFDVADMVPAFEADLRTLATSPFMDMLTAAGYGVGQGSWVPGVLDPIDLFTNGGEFPSSPVVSGLFGLNGPPVNDPAASFYAAQGYTSTWLDGSKAPTITDAQIQAEIESNIISGNLVAPDGSQIYVVFVQPGVLTSVGALAYHGSFIDPQFFGSTVIHYTVEPFLDYGNGMYNSGISAAAEYATGVVNPNFLFPLNTGDSTGMGTITPGSAANAGTAVDHNMLDLGANQIYIPTAMPPNPNVYLGYDGMTFDMICFGVSHEVAEEATDPEVSVGNPSDPTFMTSNPAWADTLTGNEICDSLPPTSGTYIFDSVTNSYFYVTKICTQIPQSNPGGSFGGENAVIAGPNDYSSASSGYMDSAGSNLLFDRMWDGHVMLKYQIGGTGAWNTFDLTNMTGAPLAVSDVSAVNYNGSPLVFFKSASNHLIATYWNGSSWQFADLMQISGFGFNSQLLQGVPSQFYINFNAAMLTSPPVAVVYRGTIDVFDVDPYGHIEDTFYLPWSGWGWGDVTNAPGYSLPASGAAINSDPTTTDIFPSRLAASTDGNIMEVVYKDMFDNPEMLEWTGSSWVWFNISQQFFSTSGGFQSFSALPKFHAGSSPTVADFQGSTYMFYRDVSNTIQEIAHNNITGVWSRRSLTLLAILPPAGDDPTAYVAGNTLHVIFQTATGGLTGLFGMTGVIGGNIWDASTTDGTFWTRKQLSTVVGNANFPIFGTPSVIARGNTIDMFFMDPVEATLYDNNQFGVGLAGSVLDNILAEIIFTPGTNPIFGGFLDPVLNVP